MNLELQGVLDRLETVERQARAWKLLVLIAILLGAGAIALPLLRGGVGATPAGDNRARFAVVEANRFILRDNEGRAAGGLEVTAEGSLKLVLGSGYGAMGAAFLEVQRDGPVHLTLRGPDGELRAALIGSRTSSLDLAGEAHRVGARLRTNEEGTGTIQLTDAVGRTRFRAP